MRTSSLASTFVIDVPESLEPSRIYVSLRHATAVHLCACGCGCEVVTPIDREGWTMSWNGTAVSLHPSVGSWSLPCSSHYLVRDGRVIWLSNDMDGMDDKDDPEPSSCPSTPVPEAGSLRRLASRPLGLVRHVQRWRSWRPWRSR